MNTVHSSASNQDKIGSLIRKQKPDNRKDDQVSSDNTAKQANTIKNKELSALSSKTTSNEAGKDNNKDKLEINEYLKIISRLENKLNLDELMDEDLDKVSSSLEERILSLTDVQKQRLRNMKFFKENGIDNIKDLKKTLFEMFKDPEERKLLFEFLKSPEFMALLLNESDKPFTYSANMVASPNNASRNNLN